MKTKPTVAPYGSWNSPVSSHDLAADSIEFGDLRTDGECLYWIESRPEERGRCAIFRRSPDGEIKEILQQPYSARSRVHEYGGGAFLVDQGTVYFSNFSDQRIYVGQAHCNPRPITMGDGFRYADYVSDAKRNRLIGVRENHYRDRGQVDNEIVGIGCSVSAKDVILISGSDFYSSPRLSPDGAYLAWLSWSHPNMPWDESELWVAQLDDAGYPKGRIKVAGGNRESVQQPWWSEEGELYFVSDRSNWWNLYRWEDGVIERVYKRDAEFGRPQWLLGLMNYGLLDSGSIVCSYTVGGTWFLGKIGKKDRCLEEFDLPFTYFDCIRVLGEKVYCLAGSPEIPLSLIEFDLLAKKFLVLRCSIPSSAVKGHTSLPESLEFPTVDGHFVNGNFYPPTNDRFTGPSGTRPPLIVKIHGGPTSATDSVFSMKIQFWTSRGFAVFDINHRGSSGFGRKFRNLLNKNWGIVDVMDCVMGAQFLVDNGLVDEDKLIIRGGSAGGFTTLSAIAFHDLFKAGASYYGVSDLIDLAKDTHKFEARYLDRLIGPLPESRGDYFDRSPINSLQTLSAPIIFFQGLEDEVVPASQTESMVKALKKKGVPVAYVPFEGEQHGFRRAESIIRAHEAELFFYSQVLSFPIDDKLDPVAIFNSKFS